MAQQKQSILVKNKGVLDMFKIFKLFEATACICGIALMIFLTAAILTAIVSNNMDKGTCLKRQQIIEIRAS